MLRYLNGREREERVPAAIYIMQSYFTRMDFRFDMACSFPVWALEGMESTAAVFPLNFWRVSVFWVYLKILCAQWDSRRQDLSIHTYEGKVGISNAFCSTGITLLNCATCVWRKKLLSYIYFINLPNSVLEFSPIDFHVLFANTVLSTKPSC